MSAACWSHTLVQSGFDCWSGDVLIHTFDMQSMIVSSEIVPGSLRPSSYLAGPANDPWVCPASLCKQLTVVTSEWSCRSVVHGWVYL